MFLKRFIIQADRWEASTPMGGSGYCWECSEEQHVQARQKGKQGTAPKKIEDQSRNNSTKAILPWTQYCKDFIGQWPVGKSQGLRVITSSY